MLGESVCIRIAGAENMLKHIKKIGVSGDIR